MTAYYWGNDFQDGAGYAPPRSVTSTVPVGSLRPYAHGLSDMLGNVWQWTGDCWNSNYNGRPRDSSAWTTGDCGRRVLRGGSWNNNPRNLRVSNRNSNEPSNRNNNNGVRCAWDAGRRENAAARAGPIRETRRSGSAFLLPGFDPGASAVETPNINAGPGLW